MNKVWRTLRSEVLKEQHNECQICKGNGLVEIAVTVHHVKYVRYFPQLALDKDNLMCVCKECHYKIHHHLIVKKQLNVERW